MRACAVFAVLLNGSCVHPRKKDRSGGKDSDACVRLVDKGDPDVINIGGILGRRWDMERDPQKMK